MTSFCLPRRHVLLAIVVAMNCLGGLLAIGCDSADYTVAKNAESPNGYLSALLVQRRGHDSLSSDVYYVILVNGKTAIPNLSKATHGKPILVATNGQKLGIQWSGPNALNIVCMGCGIRPIDIMDKEERAGSVSITYVGFPMGTATSR